MGKYSITTKELTGARVVGGRNGTRRIGKVRQFVFHPTEKRCIGFIVKRPDFLWMFHRKNLFVSINGYDYIDGQVCVRSDSDATDRNACKSLGVNWDSCVIWTGLPVIDEEGEAYGIVDNITFNRVSGAIEGVMVGKGATSNTLLGKREIPSSMILGFKKGIGSSLMISDNGDQYEDQEPIFGAILVSSEVAELTTEGGLAEIAGQASATAIDKIGKTTASTKKKVEEATADVRQKTNEVAKKTGKAINKGAYKTGKQIHKSKGMFKAFKEEYDKARHDEK